MTLFIGLIKFPLGTFAFVFALLMVIEGCGGSSGTHASSGSSNFVSDLVRDKIINNAQKAVQAVPVNSSGLQNQALLATALQGVSGLGNVQENSDGSVTSTFSDGVPFVVFNNRPANASPSITRPKGPAERTVPNAGQVVLEEGFGNAYNQLNVPLATSSFNSFGYSATSGVASVPQLRALGGSSIGVLDLAGHGCPLTVVNIPSYGIFTSSAYSLANAVQNDPDLQDHALGFGVAGVNLGPTGQIVDETHYIILPNFITKYKWNFSDNSFVFLDACSGGAPVASAFQQALFFAGASVIQGYSTTEKFGGSTADFLFDRMLGAYKVAPFPATPQRALSLSDSLAAFVSPPEPNPISVVNPSDTSQRFTALEPTISSASVSGLTLTLTGEFGMPSGTNTIVNVNGATTTGIKMTSTGLTAALANTLSGPVPVFAQVTTPDGRTLTSNTVQVSVSPFWVGNWSFQNKEDPLDYGTAVFGAHSSVEFNETKDGTSFAYGGTFVAGENTLVLSVVVDGISGSSLYTVTTLDYDDCILTGPKYTFAFTRQ